MKRFFAVIALALCITIGGVYAAWSYSATNDVLDVNQTKALQMAGAVESGAPGQFVVDTTGLTLLIDDTNGDHKPELTYEGQVVVKFIPEANAEGTVKDNGITAYTRLTATKDLDTEWVVDLDGDSDDHTYEPVWLLHLTGGTHTIGALNTSEAVKWTYNNLTGEYTYTFSAEDIANNHIVLNELTVDTYAKYQLYDAALELGLLRFEISDQPYS